MSPDRLTLEAEIADTLRSRVRVGEAPSVPYARRWEVGGCEAIHSLRTYPYDGIVVLSRALATLGRTMVPIENGLLIRGTPTGHWVAANRDLRGDGPPDAYLVGREHEQLAQYTGNSPEVVIELLRGIRERPPGIPTSAELQVGFPGLHIAGVTYVGSWQWHIHGEARDDEFVCRAAVATLSAIEAKRAENAE